MGQKLPTESSFERSSEAIDAFVEYVPNNNELDAVLYYIEEGIPVILRGPPGCGKTSCLQHSCVVEHSGAPVMQLHKPHFWLRMHYPSCGDVLP